MGVSADRVLGGCQVTRRHGNRNKPEASMSVNPFVFKSHCTAVGEPQRSDAAKRATQDGLTGRTSSHRYVCNMCWIIVFVMFVRIRIY